MKILAETTGDFMLTDMSTGHDIQSTRPSVIARSHFIDSRIAIGQVTKVADVPDEATDEEFLAFWIDSGDRDLAIASFLSKFDENASATPRARKVSK